MDFEAPGYEDFYGISGVYIFCRKYGKSISPIYIGKSLDIGKRIKQHLNSRPLMKEIVNAMSGNKILIIGEFNSKKGQQTDKCIKIVEQALIDHALAQGHSLFNEKGTKTPIHSITYQGNLTAKNFTKQAMNVKI